MVYNSKIITFSRTKALNMITMSRSIFRAKLNGFTTSSARLLRRQCEL